MKEINERAEENGVDVIGGLEAYRVALNYLECKETDDGFFGGNRDELTVTITCGEEQASHSLQMSAKEVEFEECPKRGIGGLPLSKANSMVLLCEKGNSVKIALTEDDTFSPTDGGGNTVGWDFISDLTIGAPVKFGVGVGSTSTWDKIGDWLIDNVGLCATDFIPFAKAGKFSKKAKKFLKGKAEAAIQAGVADALDMKIAQEPEEADWKTDPKRYVEEKFDEVQCLQSTAGSYMVQLQFFGAACGFPSLIPSILSIVFVLIWQ